MFPEGFVFGAPLVTPSQRPRLIASILARDPATTCAVLTESPLPDGLCLFGVLTRSDDGMMGMILVDRTGKLHTGAIPAMTPTEILNVTTHPDYVEAIIGDDVYRAEVKVPGLPPQSEATQSMKPGELYKDDNQAA